VLASLHPLLISQSQLAGMRCEKSFWHSLANIKTIIDVFYLQP